MRRRRRTYLGLYFSPLSLSPVLWVKYNTGQTVTGSGVSQWDDQSGNGNHLLQGTDANRPTLQSDGSVLFDGVAHFLKANAFTLNQPTTVYICLNQKTWEASDDFIDGDTSNTGLILQAVSSPNIRAFAGTFGTTISTFTLDTYGVVTVVFNGASSILRHNKGTEVTEDFGSSNMGGFTLGARADGLNRFSNIEVREVAVFDTAHDSIQRNSMIEYMARVGEISL